ncbi:MAG: hypothetical protein QOG34_1582, partial [Frankiaceae bacterium]|nr:hypothetical protein [Frankiaceae bacterium]
MIKSGGLLCVLALIGAGGCGSRPQQALKPPAPSPQIARAKIAQGPDPRTGKPYAN